MRRERRNMKKREERREKRGEVKVPCNRKCKVNAFGTTNNLSLCAFD